MIKVKMSNEKNTLKNILPILITIIVGINLVLINNVESEINEQDNKINTLNTLISATGERFSGTKNPNDMDLSGVNIDELKSTGASVAAVFPLEGLRSAEDVMLVILPTGIPDYGPGLGVSYDDPVNSLAVLARMENTGFIKLNPEELQRYLNLVTKPLGISCEYCCGLKYVGVRDDGKSSCGCQHNPALLTIVRYLIQSSDYTDAEILREAMRWKALFFPKDMVKLSLQIAGGDEATLKELELSGMVGGC